ncbi:MAG: STT3 domain-containing protein [Candidatus Thermoplasmatota archaeon]|nr:STT3 domain-containing protein [Candidatus Thermoplasmatota archaeon]
MAKGIKIKKWVIPLVIGAFFLVLFLNTYFNYTSGVAINGEVQSLTDKFYLAGPDPYYNARLVEKTVETGHYPYLGGVHGDEDPLLNYPLGRSGGRPPLFNMVTTGVGKIISPFVGETDGLGYAMQFLPAIYGALLVIPVYMMGSRLFNKKAGILGAFMVALIPIHLSSGHGSAYSLYDHDSFILLLTTTTIMFLVMSLKEKDAKKSMIYAFMSGIGVAGVSMTWVSAEYIYAIIAVYGIAQMVIDIIASRINPSVPRTLFIALFTGYGLAFPLFWIKYGFSPSVHLIILLAVAVFSGIYLWLGKNKIPWVISIPSIFGIGAAGLASLYVIRNTTSSLLKPFTSISNIIFGSGIYGNKTSLTIAEASTFDFSKNVMSFGPVLYWLAWAGFLFLIYRYYKNRSRREYFLLIVWFLIEAWLTRTAGRFLNDLVPLVAVLGGWVLWMTIDKLDFQSVVKTIKGVGGGWYGLKKGVKVRHVIGAAFVVFLVVMPNGWLAFDASLPLTMKGNFDTDKLGAFGLGLHTEEYWTDAFSWLRQQNEGINDTEKPAFISWWDYGFYCAALAENPTVADNFQDGIEPAANFQTASSEKEAVAVWIVRLAEGDMAKNGGKLSGNVTKIFGEYFGNESQDLIKILEEPAEHENTSYNKIIGEEYGGKKYLVREKNAMYHDAIEMLTKLDDEDITWIYHKIQNATGNSIRYYGVEGYDVNIFNVFTFLADKGTFGYETSEDDYFKMWYVSDKTGQKFTPQEVRNLSEEMTPQERIDAYGNFTPQTVRKDPFYNSMVYKTYLGASVSKQIFENQTQYRQYLYMLMQPTVGLKHFVVEYVSPMTQNKSLYFARGSLCFGCPAVVISKYYEGAEITGTLKSDGEAMEGVMLEVQKNVTMYDRSVGITHDYTLTDGNGHFTVIAPAGNITLVVSQGAGQDRVIIKKITFNGTGNFTPITDDEAMRRVSTWQRDIGIININKGSVEGTVYWDKDGDGKYNDSIDAPLPNVKVEIGGREATTNSRGHYEVHSLLPDSYQITATKQGYDITGQKQVAVKPDETTINNISMVPSKVKVSGATWYDANSNGARDTNESVAGVSIKFVVVSAPDENADNATVLSNETGYYTRYLFPATYAIEVDFSVNVENETVRYVYSDTLKINIGDSTKTLDIKLSKVE